MTVTTARVAGVKNVVLATPNRSDVMLGAAYLAGAEQVLWAGGAHAVAALAYGTETVPKVDIIVGPGNAWVTAAKAIVSDTVSIDMLAGPSELVILADDTADPEIIAADLLAQAEHDPDARPILVTVSVDLADAVDAALDRQTQALTTAAIAQQALQNGFTIVCDNASELISAVDQLAPEHLEVMGDTVEPLAPQLTHYGALFLGSAAAEVIGDYGVGPNHVLPTGGTARQTGGLSVFNFLRIRTWIEVDDTEAARALYEDAEALAKLEGLSGHANAAALRMSD